MLFVVDQRTASVIEFDSIKPGAAFTRHQPDASVGPLAQPWAVVRGPRRTLVVADSGHNRIVVFDLKNATTIALAPPPGAAIGNLNKPRGVAIGPDGRLAIADTGNRRIVWTGFTVAEAINGTADLQAWNAFGQPTSSGSTGPGDFQAPTGIHVDDADRTWVTDPGLGRLIRMDATDGSGWTTIDLPVGIAPLQPFGIAGHPLGVLVTDLVNARILMVDAADSAAVIIEGSVDRRIIAPLTAVGHRKNLIVADSAGARLVRWSPDGAGGWQHSGELLGSPGPLGGPTFTQITGLGTSGATQ